MASSIKFPFYIKTDCGSTFVKMLSPYESIEVVLSECVALIYRVKHEEEFTGSYKDYLNDVVMYSNKEEFEKRVHEATRQIFPESIALINQIHPN